MGHSHPVYDTDTHFIIDPITRAVTNAESKKTLLMQHDHNSEEFSFEVDKVVEGHDLTLCNQIEVHFSNVDQTKRNSSHGVYEVKNLEVTDAGDKVVFTWVISENATLYAGSLNFLIKFMCVENGVVTYRWNTAPNNSIVIGKGMQNGEAITEAYPDILVQWKEELFAAVYGYKSMSIGPVEPETYPYVWFDTSDGYGEDIGVIKIKDIDGNVQEVHPYVEMESIIGLVEVLEEQSETMESLTEHMHTPESVNAFPNIADNTFSNCDSLTDGVWRLDASDANLPESSSTVVFHKTWDSNFAVQLALTSTEQSHVRYKVGGTWNTWSRMPRQLWYTDITVAASSFVSDATHEKYPYRAAVSLANVESDMYSDVVFSQAALDLGILAGTTTAYNGGIYIYASKKPEVNIVISSIIITA